MGEKGQSSGNKGKRIHRVDTKKIRTDIQHSDLQRDPQGLGEGKLVERIIVKSVLKGLNATLVQWEENKRIHRGWIPNGSIDADWRVSNIELQRSMPYGLPFHEILNSVIIDNSVLADELRRRNIWTEQDVIKNPMEIARAISATAQISVSIIQTWVREFARKQGEEVNRA